MFCTCNTCVGYAPGLHMYFYTCYRGVRYTPVLHYETCILHVFYTITYYRCINYMCKCAQNTTHVKYL